MSEEQKSDDLEPGEINVPSVPSSWELVDFELAFELVSTNDRKVPSSDYLSEGPLPVVDQGKQFIGGFTDKVDLAIEPGDGLLVFGDHTRAFKSIDFSFAAGADGIKILRPRMTSMKYAFYASSSLRFPNKGYARHYSHLRKCKFPVAPLEEQKRIVFKLDELFSQIENGERTLERVRKLMERYRQSVLKAAVTGELTREWREQHAGELESGEALLNRILEARHKAWETAEVAKMTDQLVRPINDLWKKRYKELAAPDTAGYSELPTGWSWATLPMLCAEDSINGISVKGGNTPPGVAALRLDAITANGFDYSAIRYIPISQTKAARLSVCTGDFFISRANGSIRLVGKAVLANQPPGVVVFPDTMIRYRLLASPDLRNWLQTVWPSRFIRSQIEKLAKTTAGIHKISQGDIGQIAIPLPPLQEQAEIRSLVELRLSQAEKMLQEAESSIKMACSVRRATLKVAFSGGLVSQDSSDEPASVLLERIAAQRAAAASEASAAKERKSQRGFPAGLTNKSVTTRATAGKATPRKPTASKGKAKA